MLEMAWHQPQTSIVGLMQILHVALQFVIQIKICAEYQDMLPRPRLVCLSASAQVYLTNPAEAWVACPGILHRY